MFPAVLATGMVRGGMAEQADSEQVTAISTPLG
jgi:hypothetical protein